MEQYKTNMFLKYKKKTALIIIGAVFFVALDRLLKLLAVDGIRFDILGDILKFNFVKNFNIAFSLPLGGDFLLWFILVVIIGLLYNFVYLYKKQEYLLSSFLMMIVLGAISNVLDRIKYGFVIDYLDLKYFTVFNISDFLIVFGVILLLFFYNKNNKYSFL
jgi:signal peptidase II